MALVANFSVVPPLFSSVKNFEFFMANVLTCHNDIPNDLVLITCQHLVVESINSYLSPAVWLETFQDLNSTFRLYMLYMSSCFWLLQVKSRDLSQAEKERTACKASKLTKWQLFSLKMTTSTILSENVILCICSTCNNIYMSLVKWNNSRNSRQKMRT